MVEINPQTLQPFLSEALCQRIRKQTGLVPIVTNPLPQAFLDDFIKPSQPALIRGLTEHWPARAKWTFDFFLQELGQLKVTANLYSETHRVRMKLKELIQQVVDPYAEYPAYLQEWWYALDSPDLKADFSIPDYFSDDISSGLMGFDNSHIWIGGAGAFTPLHQDQMHAHIWCTQIQGNKRWFLLDRNVALYPDDREQPDVERLLLEYPKGVYVVDMEPGDMLFVPCQWWHATQALQPCISLSNFYITPEIAVEYIRDVISIPVRVALQGEDLKKHDPFQYQQLKEYTEMLEKLLGLSKRLEEE